MQSGIIGGHARTSLVNTSADVNITGATASLDFGTFNVGLYSQFIGLLSVGSIDDAIVNLQLDFLATSGGSTIVASALPVNSGGMHFSTINPANYVNVSLTDITSDTPYTLLMMGEPIR